MGVMGMGKKRKEVEWIWLPHEQYVYYVASLLKKKKMKR
jgi:hypothetical protein